ncbi:hypothetical protein FQN57_005168 [Myotisia sp. PD_48]|nr:hypothetical protein FQN57_005168 [Myotisia sp. PD_48]
MAPSRSLKSFRLLSFDIYGTLIDWEAGILSSLQPLVDRLDDSHPLKSNLIALGAEFNKHEREIQGNTPGLSYNLVLKECYKRFAKAVGATPTSVHGGTSSEQLLEDEGTAFAENSGSWPAFTDTVAAMRRLKSKGYKLVPLSNIDRVSFSKTLNGPLAGLHDGMAADQPFFDAVYTAQDIGSYKPDLANFEYLISHVKVEFGVDKDDILHVAQSLHHDHEPAKKMGLHSAWIARGEGGVTGMGGDVAEYVGKTDKVAFGWKFDDLKALADAIDQEEV